MTSSEPPAEQGPIGPDVSEEELGGEIDNIVPSRGYALPRVIGLGGSAGSIKALQSFLASLSPESGMAFVIILHLSPEHESMLSEVLQPSTTMGVATATDNERVAPNRVYVIPPGKQLTMFDGRLRLTALPREPGRRMSVDIFFRSLADVYGPHSVAIVFSGGDGDGAIGIKRIKERGGLTIAQDPSEAEHQGMPRSAIDTGMVDWVLKATEIAPRLIDYDARERRLQMPPETGPNPAVPARPAADSDEAALRDVLTFLRTRTGHDFSYYKRATIVRRVARRMQVNEVETLPAYLNFLRTHPGEAAALQQDLLISVTNFFRDREAFAKLEGIVPELFRGKTHSDTIRVWVPACATGEEAYSIAMLLSEHARLLDSPPSIQIFATDLDEDIVLQARNGQFPDAITTDVSVDRLKRFFVRQHHGYRVRRELREMLLFAVHDLLKDSPFSTLDLISCRNLLIYLNREAQLRVFDIFHFALRPDGHLFLGTSESVEDSSQQFQALDKKHRLYARRGSARGSLPIPSGPSTLARALALQERNDMTGPTSLGKPLPVSGLIAGAARTAPVARPSWAELHVKLLERLGPPSIVVNAEHDVVHLSESASQFLQLPSGEPSINVLSLIKPSLRVELRAALFRSRQTGSATLAEGVIVELAGQNRAVDLRVVPVGDAGAEFTLVMLQSRDTVVAPAEVLPQQRAAIVDDIERELAETKRDLRNIVEQHEASTEELKASNEELQAMNEELRSATEELETSREELQSINEELTTVNQELKVKVDELAQANSDLHNLMGATAIPTIFLDRELHITRFTPPAVELFSLIGSDVGRPLAHLQHRLAYDEMLSDAARVLHQLAPIEREIADVNGRHFLSRILPYRAAEDRIAGVVLTFIDVTDRQAAQDAVRRAHADLEQRVHDRTSELDSANLALRNEVLGHERAERLRLELQRRLTQTQEEERRRISRDLHDHIGQEVTSLMLMLGALESTADGATLGKVRELRATAERVGREVHRVALELRPVALDELGLARALASYLEAWQTRTGIAVDLVSVGIEERRLPSVLETTLYRTVQEAMNNVYKHAAAKAVSVSVERRHDRVIAIVEDDGVGFESDALDWSDSATHIGLIGMQERADIAGGDLTVSSKPGHGTTIRLNLPLAPD